MTKHVRIENADTSSFKVVVEAWEKGQNGEPDILVSTQRLDYPTAITDNNTYLTSTRYIVVKEAPQ